MQRSPTASTGSFCFVASLPLRAPARTISPIWTIPPTASALAATRAGACLVTPRFAAKVPARHGRARHAAGLSRLRAGPGAPVPVRHAARNPPSPRPASRRAPSSTRRRGWSTGSGRSRRGHRARCGDRRRHARSAPMRSSARRSRSAATAPSAANVTVSHAFIGNRVILHPGVRIGQDGFGFAMGPQGHLKVPQVGRVIIQDDVEIGANTTIDRGASRDTVIGEGTKIDNLVQIAHNVVIGRHCVIVAQVGIAGSTTRRGFRRDRRPGRREGPCADRHGRPDRRDQRRQRRCSGRRPLGRHPGPAHARVVPRDHGLKKLASQAAIPPKTTTRLRNVR